MKKKLIAALTGLTILAVGTAGAFAGSYTGINFGGVERVPVNALGQRVYPINDNGTVMVPVRYIAENFGCSVAWDQNAQSVNIEKYAVGTLLENIDETHVRVAIEGDIVTLYNVTKPINGAVKLKVRQAEFVARGAYQTEYRDANRSYSVPNDVTNSIYSDCYIYFDGNTVVGVGAVPEV